MYVFLGNSVLVARQAGGLAVNLIGHIFMNCQQKKYMTGSNKWHFSPVKFVVNMRQAISTGSLSGYHELNFLKTRIVAVEKDGTPGDCSNRCIRLLQLVCLAIIMEVIYSEIVVTESFIH